MDEGRLTPVGHAGPAITQFCVARSFVGAISVGIVLRDGLMQAVVAGESWILNDQTNRGLERVWAVQSRGLGEPGLG